MRVEAFVRRQPAISGLGATYLPSSACSGAIAGPGPQPVPAGSTASLVVLGPPHVSPAQKAFWYTFHAAAPWPAVASVAWTSAHRRPEPQGRPAGRWRPDRRHSDVDANRRAGGPPYREEIAWRLVATR